MDTCRNNSTTLTKNSEFSIEVLQPTPVEIRFVFTNYFHVKYTLNERNPNKIFSVFDQISPKFVPR